MEVASKYFESGQIIVEAGTTVEEAMLIVSGIVRIEGNLQNSEIKRDLILGRGDWIIPEALFVPKVVDYRVVAEDDVELFATTKEKFQQEMLNLSPALADWVKNEIKQLAISNGIVLANEKIIFKVCNLLLILMRANSKFSNINRLKMPLDLIIQELRCTASERSRVLETILSSLSEVGLVDMRTGDPLTASILMPNVYLFAEYVDYLRKLLDIPEYKDQYLQSTPLPKLSDQSNKILDTLLTDDELSLKVFEPERSVVHLSVEGLNQLLKKRGLPMDLNHNHKALIELEELHALSSVVDNQIHSLFINMREMLRLNILRDKEENFKDITEYLFDRLIEIRNDYLPVSDRLI